MAPGLRGISWAKHRVVNAGAVHTKYITNMVVIATLHYTTLHYATLHYTTLHYATPHYTTLCYTMLHYTINVNLHYTILHSLQSISCHRC